MRILHTSDWHLGKNLENESRLDEQKQFLEELSTIAEKGAVDMIIVAGDIYDAINPPTKAERLFFESIVELSQKGERPVIVIAGNHDSPERLGAASMALSQVGVIVVESVNSVVELYENQYYKIIRSGPGFFEIEMKGERAVLINMPYPSERRLNMILTDHNKEELMQKDYSAKIGELLSELSKEFAADTINIMTGHLFVTGGEESGSERNISLGGSMAVHSDKLPVCQYIAMGHLHRPQKINCEAEAAFYSGSPIQYSKSEINYSKAVYLADLKAGEPPVVFKEYLSNYKPIEIWHAKSIEQAIQMCEKHSEENSWVYIEIETDRALTPLEMKLMRMARKDIVEITPLFTWEETEDEGEFEERTMEEDFEAFYTHNKGVPPTEEIIKIFAELFPQDE